jgi:hypothetical protein
MRLIPLLITALAIALAASPASAQICFGTQNQLVFVQKLPIRSPENKPMHLARLLQKSCLGLPYSITDAGYVMAVEGEEGMFALTERQIASFQSSRALPRPLPAYEMGMGDWIMGHLLWGTLFPVVMVIGFIVWGLRSQPALQPRQRRPARPERRR